MSVPCVSIILPVHNGERYLPEAIAACRAQSMSDWELILVDDASTDRTPEILADAVTGDPRIRSVRNRENLKLPGSLNVGFAQARGRYWTWTSDDNRYRPEALQRMAGALERGGAGTGVVYGGMLWIDEAGRPVGRAPCYVPEALGFRGNVVGGCFLFRPEVFAATGGYAEDLFLVEDYYFWLCAAGVTRFDRVPEVLYEYRRHDGSLSRRFPGQDSRGETAFRRALERTPPPCRSLRAGICFSLGMWYALRHRGGESRRELLEALRADALAVLLRASPRHLAGVFLGRL